MVVCVVGVAVSLDFVFMGRAVRKGRDIARRNKYVYKQRVRQMFTHLFSPANNTCFSLKSAKGSDAPAAIAKRTNAAVASETSPCCSTNLTWRDGAGEARGQSLLTLPKEKMCKYSSSIHHCTRAPQEQTQIWEWWNHPRGSDQIAHHGIYNTGMREGQY